MRPLYFVASEVSQMAWNSGKNPSCFFDVMILFQPCVLGTKGRATDMSLLLGAC